MSVVTGIVGCAGLKVAFLSFFLFTFFEFYTVSLGVAVRLMSCDLEVMGSNPGNSLSIVGVRLRVHL